MTDLKCQFCGAPLMGRRKRYCSQECARKAILQREQACRAEAAGSTRISKNRRDITGMQFGELTAIRRVEQDHWLFLCSCGKEVVLRSSTVMYGTQKSCGHLVQSATGISGVQACPRKNGVVYRAHIKCRERNIELGIYETIEEAAAARKAAEIVRDHIQTYDSDLSPNESTIAQHRVKAGLSRRQLGDMLGVSTQVVGDWERRDSLPRDQDTRKKLEEILGFEAIDPKKSKKLIGADNPIFKQRKSAGISITRLAELVGVSRSAVYAWERSGIVPRPETLKKVADALGCDMDDLDFHPKKA